MSKPDDSIMKYLYNILCNLNNAGFTTWVSHVENMLTEVGLYHVWESQTCDDYTVKLLGELLYKSFENTWNVDVCNVILNPKLRTYCTFKHDFKMEPYLSSIRDFKVRKILTRFRISNHVLQIEKGRHCKPKIPIDERLCKMCDSAAIEDEKHFLCDCNLYTDLRKSFIISCRTLGFYGVENNFNLEYLLNNNDIVFYVGKLLLKMFALRQSVIDNK